MGTVVVHQYVGVHLSYVKVSLGSILKLKLSVLGQSSCSASLPVCDCVGE